MEELVIAMASKYPVIIGIFTVIGILRAVNKPLFAFIRSYVQATETKKDDALLDKVEQSKVYSYVCFVLDWFASVKMDQIKK